MVGKVRQGELEKGPAFGLFSLQYTLRPLRKSPAFDLTPAMGRAMCNAEKTGTSTMRLTLALASAALVGLALPLAAQDAEPEDTPVVDAPAESVSTETPAETPAPASPVDDLGLDMGSEMNDGPRPGEYYLREEFGDWAMRCIFLPEQDDPCELYQLLYGPDETAVAEVMAFPLPPGGQAAAGLTIVAPLETLLTEGAVLSIGGENARRYEFTFCNRAGCVARIGLTEGDVATLKRGTEAGLRIVPAADPSHPFDLTISLMGFTAAMESSEAYDPSLLTPDDEDGTSDESEGAAAE